MKSTVRVWNVFMAFALMLGVLLATPRQTAVQAAGPAELFFSEYVEGSSNNKALEIYNGTDAAVDLAAGGYNIHMSFNGGTSTYTINLTGVVAHNDVYVVTATNANATLLALADQSAGTSWFNGDDAVALRKGTTIIDVIGQIGFDPGSQWGTDLTSTQDNTMRRKASILAGDPNGSDVFDPAVEWVGFAVDTFDGLGSHTVELPVETAPFVATTSPANGATNVPVSSDITITFSEPVNIIDPWFDLTCSTSGTVLADVSGGPTIFTLDPVADFVNETCTLTVYAA
ncbi:MAG: Ig-like domain-containing protein, partial [Bellilinea sp.]